jgi:small subunit ribosomal protein S1
VVARQPPVGGARDRPDGRGEDIDRERQRISLGLKQTQSDPWQQVLSSYHENDVVEGRVTKVVTFGAFVEILPGVEGLVHISELAQHHVENPREVVAQGQPVNVKIIEVDGDRRRLSLSLKRVEDTDPVQPRADGAESVHTRPNLDLSEDVFAEEPLAETPTDAQAPADEAVEEAPVDEAAPPTELEEAAPVEAEAAVVEPELEAVAEPEPDPEPEAEPEAAAPEPEASSSEE